MNLKHLNLDLHGIPDDVEIQIPVFLIAHDLKARKLNNALTSIGCDNCFCISDLCDLILAYTGFENRPDELYEYYFDLLNQHCNSVTMENDMPVREAFAIYRELRHEAGRLTLKYSE